MREIAIFALFITDFGNNLKILGISRNIGKIGKYTTIYIMKNAFIKNLFRKLEKIVITKLNTNISHHRVCRKFSSIKTANNLDDK